MKEESRDKRVDHAVFKFDMEEPTLYLMLSFLLRQWIDFAIRVIMKLRIGVLMTAAEFRKS